MCCYLFLHFCCVLPSLHVDVMANCFMSYVCLLWKLETFSILKITSAATSNLLPWINDDICSASSFWNSSIHWLYSLSVQGCGRAGASPRWHRTRAGFTWTVHQSMTGPHIETNNLTSLVCMQEAGEPGENPHRHGENIQTLRRTVPPQPGNEPTLSTVRQQC